MLNVVPTFNFTDEQQILGLQRNSNEIEQERQLSQEIHFLSQSVKGTTQLNVDRFDAPRGAAWENIHFVN